jgi:4-carboxymuconolactone decarboxylase
VLDWVIGSGRPAPDGRDRGGIIWRRAAVEVHDQASRHRADTAALDAVTGSWLMERAALAGWPGGTTPPATWAGPSPFLDSITIITAAVGNRSQRAGQLSGSWTTPGAMPDSSPDINDDRPAVHASRSLASVPAGTRKGVTTMAESELFDKGLQARREVLGAEYVDANLADTDEFMMAFQRVVTEWAWGYAWSRPGLDRKTRSMLNLAILTALGRPDELGIYVKGAIGTGVSVDEIKEILIHATVYCGTPAGRQAFRAAHEALLAEGVLDRPS